MKKKRLVGRLPVEYHKTLYLAYEGITMAVPVDLEKEHLEIWGMGDEIIIERIINQTKPPFGKLRVMR